ncbi:uncharacterized protein [Montipora capricornis]|uniref:uncharacterized protein n=1 Tax=Montipora capricornis TaxID=246305 RepID=UPI0035F11A81
MEIVIKVLVLFLLVQAYEVSTSSLCNFDSESSATRWVQKQCVFVFANQTDSKFIGRELQLMDNNSTKEAFQFIEADFNKFFNSPLTLWNHSCNCTKVPCLNEKQWNDLFAYSVERARKEAIQRWPFFPRLCCSIQHVVIEILYRIYEEDIQKFTKIISENMNISILDLMDYLGYELPRTKWCYSFKDKCDGFIFRMAKGCEITERRMRRGIGFKSSAAACQSSSWYQDVNVVSLSPLVSLEKETSLQIWESRAKQNRKSVAFIKQMVTKTYDVETLQVRSSRPHSYVLLQNPSQLWSVQSTAFLSIALSPSPSILPYVTQSMTPKKEVSTRKARKFSRIKRTTATILDTTYKKSPRSTKLDDSSSTMSDGDVANLSELSLASSMSTFATSLFFSASLLAALSSSLSTSSQSPLPTSKSLASQSGIPIFSPYTSSPSLILASNDAPLSPTFGSRLSRLSKPTASQNTNRSLSPASFETILTNHSYYTSTILIASSRTLPILEVSSKQSPTLTISTKTLLVRFKGTCGPITNIELFKLRCKTTLAHRLQLSRSDVIVDNVICGSIEVTFAIQITYDRNVTAELWGMINNSSLIIEYDGKEYRAFDLKIVSKPQPTVSRFSTPLLKPTTIYNTTNNNERKKLAFIIFVLFCSIFAALLVFFSVVFLSRFCQKPGKLSMHRKVPVRERDFELRCLSTQTNQILGVNYYGEFVHSEENHGSNLEIFEEDINDYYEDEFAEELPEDTNRYLLNSNHLMDNGKPQQKRVVLDDEDSCSSVVFY